MSFCDSENNKSVESLFFYCQPPLSEVDPYPTAVSFITEYF